ncbi:hypothetical protein FIBSPDRAFT_900813 [Athelia psychrophila]|uniref:Uncharacterized protein n=1 Tax=Athelia psychrophila TaxID=1759441 RepID=A0A165XYF2_9AGAM|nr:hypothetical protein FIBSPDRAFT_900813 [Fibularhizoctonia sp. CBS 109695]
MTHIGNFLRCACAGLPYRIDGLTGHNAHRRFDVQKIRPKYAPKRQDPGFVLWVQRNMGANRILLNMRFESLLLGPAVATPATDGSFSADTGDQGLEENRDRAGDSEDTEVTGSLMRKLWRKVCRVLCLG